MNKESKSNMIFSKKHKLLPVVVSLIVSCLASSLAYARSGVPDGSNVGLWPDTFLAEHTKYDAIFSGILVVNEPVVTMLDKENARISFTTNVPTLPATVYYGTYENDVPQSWVRFNAGVRESKDKDGNPITISHGPVKQLGTEFSYDHQVEIKLSNDLNPDAKPDSGVVYYRIEILSPGTYQEVPGARFFDWRFGYSEGEIVPIVAEGPFVDQITESSAIISWDSSLPANGGVSVDTTGDFSTNKKAKHIELELIGLAPGITHNYSIHLDDGSNTTTSRQFSFRTPARNTTKYTFVVLGDSRGGSGGGEYSVGGANNRVMETLARAAFAKGAEFIVHTGDMINGYTGSKSVFEQQLRAHKNSIEPIGHYIPFYEVMGNHELLLDFYIFEGDDEEKTHFKYAGILVDKKGNESTEAIFANEFVNPENGPQPDNEAAQVPEGESLPSYQENVYFFDYGNSRFIVMNNNYWINGTADLYGANMEGYILDDQKKWLLAKFEETKNDDSIEHLFIFAQEPLFPNSSSHVHDGMWYQGGDPTLNEGFDRSYIHKRRDEIWRAFVSTGKAVSGNFGDEHQYTRTLITEDADGNKFEYPTWQMVSGGSGAPYAATLGETPWKQNIKRFETQFHYTLFKVDGDNVTLETYSIDNVLIERVELTKELDLYNRETVQVSATDIDGNSSTTATKLFGGISLNGEASASPADEVQVATETDSIDIGVIIEPEEKHQGQEADILVVAHYTFEPNNDCSPENGDYYIIVKDGGREKWAANSGTTATQDEAITPFDTVDSLPAQLHLNLYKGTLDYQGYVCLTYGYRLNDGTTILNGEPIRFNVQ
jgi:hypothetical protein